MVGGADEVQSQVSVGRVRLRGGVGWGRVRGEAMERASAVWPALRGMMGVGDSREGLANTGLMRRHRGSWGRGVGGAVVGWW